ncbi:phosphoglycerate mutase family protein [Wolffia australiana]
MSGIISYRATASPILSPPCCSSRGARGVPPARSLSVASPVDSEISEEQSAKIVIPRRLILLRHGKSSWSDRSLRDHDRPLSKAGRDDAIAVSRKLHQMGWIPELILSSDSVRTKETLLLMQEHWPSFREAKVRFIPSFYSVAAMDGQTAEHLQEAVCEHSGDEILTVMCMGHNKGWEEAASMLSGASIELKTCNAALLQASGQSWKEAFATAGFGGWKLSGIVKPEPREGQC